MRTYASRGRNVLPLSACLGGVAFSAEDSGRFVTSSVKTVLGRGRIANDGCRHDASAESFEALTQEILEKVKGVICFVGLRQCTVQSASMRLGVVRSDFGQLQRHFSDVLRKGSCYDPDPVEAPSYRFVHSDREHARVWPHGFV